MPLPNSTFANIDLQEISLANLLLMSKLEVRAALHQPLYLSTPWNDGSAVVIYDLDTFTVESSLHAFAGSVAYVAFNDLHRVHIP